MEMGAQVPTCSHANLRLLELALPPPRLLHQHSTQETEMTEAQNLTATAPRLKDRRVALETLNGRGLAPEGMARQLAALAAGTLWMAGVATMAKPGIGAALSGGALGLVATWAGLRAGVALARNGLRGGGAMGFGLVAGLALMLAALSGVSVWALVLTLLGMVAACWLGWRQRRDILTDALLARGVAEARADLARDETAFRQGLEDMRARTEAEIARLSRMAGLPAIETPAE